MLGPARSGERVDDVLHRRGGVAKPLVVGGTLGQVRERAAEVSVGMADEPGFRREPEQRLHESEDEELGVAELRRPPLAVRVASRDAQRAVVDGDVQCPLESGVGLAAARCRSGSGVVLDPPQWSRCSEA